MRLHYRRYAPLLIALAASAVTTGAIARDRQWTPEEAANWYAAQPWLAGANFVPASAINQLEMWQAGTFDPETIDRDLGYAAGAGFNCMRVFLHDLAWEADPEGFYNRIERYLEIADRHSIKTMFVLFDAVWDPHPKPGTQKAPTPGVHNSGWVQGPHIQVLSDESRHESMKPYVQGILKRFGRDPRILMWDLYNEPGNTNGNSYGHLEPENKPGLSRLFLERVFTWAREAAPDQPLTAGAWMGLGRPEGGLDPLDQFMLGQSDIVTFHTYDDLEGAKRAVTRVSAVGRPMICTEYMARTANSRFEVIMPYLKSENIGAIHWGLVSGKSQTIYPWESWQKPFDSEPEVWFHDVFRPDGTPFSKAELDVIRSLTGRQ